MKHVFYRILVAASLLFLLPNLSMSQDLKGIWKLVSGDNTSREAARYKVFDKAGNYYNVDAFLEKVVDVSPEIKNQSSKAPFCPCRITRSGTYNVVSKGVYCENLKYEYGNTVNAIVPISYRIEGKTMILVFLLGRDTCREVYQKVSAIGK